MTDFDFDVRLKDLAQELNNLFQITLSASTSLRETWQGGSIPDEITDIQQAARRGAVLTRQLCNLNVGPDAGPTEDELN